MKVRRLQKVGLVGLTPFAPQLPVAARSFLGVPSSVYAVSCSEASEIRGPTICSETASQVLRIPWICMQDCCLCMRPKQRLRRVANIAGSEALGSIGYQGLFRKTQP